MGVHADSEVHNIVGRAVADTNYSALRQWMVGSVLSGDFSRLSEMLTWFAREDKILRQVFPDLRYRKMMFMRLIGNRQTAKKMLWADLAFNWRDKRGYSIPDTIAGQLRSSFPSIGEEERALLKKAAQILDTIRTERLDTYTVIEQNDEHTLTLFHGDGSVFRDVFFPQPMPENVQSRYLAANSSLTTIKHT